VALERTASIPSDMAYVRKMNYSPACDKSKLTKLSDNHKPASCNALILGDTEEINPRCFARIIKRPVPIVIILRAC
jgi:hypothetical protein